MYLLSILISLALKSPPDLLLSNSIPWEIIHAHTETHTDAKKTTKAFTIFLIWKENTASKPADLTVISRTHMIEEKTWLYKLSSDLCMHTGA